MPGPLLALLGAFGVGMAGGAANAHAEREGERRKLNNQLLLKMVSDSITAGEPAVFDTDVMKGLPKQLGIAPEMLEFWKSLAGAHGAQYAQGRAAVSGALGGAPTPQTPAPAPAVGGAAPQAAPAPSSALPPSWAQQPEGPMGPVPQPTRAQMPPAQAQFAPPEPAAPAAPEGAPSAPTAAPLVEGFRAALGGVPTGTTSVSTQVPIGPGAKATVTRSTTPGAQEAARRGRGMAFLQAHQVPYAQGVALGLAEGVYDASAFTAYGEQQFTARYKQGIEERLRAGLSAPEARKNAAVAAWEQTGFPPSDPAIRGYINPDREAWANDGYQKGLQLLQMGVMPEAIMALLAPYGMSTLQTRAITEQWAAQAYTSLVEANMPSAQAAYEVAKRAGAAAPSWIADEAKKMTAPPPFTEKSRDTLARKLNAPTQAAWEQAVRGQAAQPGGLGGMLEAEDARQRGIEVEQKRRIAAATTIEERRVPTSEEQKTEGERIASLRMVDSLTDTFVERDLGTVLGGALGVRGKASKLLTALDLGDPQMAAIMQGALSLHNILSRAQTGAQVGLGERKYELSIPRPERDSLQQFIANWNITVTNIKNLVEYARKVKEDPTLRPPLEASEKTVQYDLLKEVDRRRKARIGGAGGGGTGLTDKQRQQLQGLQ